MFCFIICRTSTRVHNKHESIKLFKLVHFQLTLSLVKIFANSCSILNMWVAKSCLGLCHHWVTGGYLSVVGCTIVCSLVTSGGPPSSAAGGASNRKGRGKAITSCLVGHTRSKITFICIQYSYNTIFDIDYIGLVIYHGQFYFVSKRKLWRVNFC